MAGLRTNALVTPGATLFVLYSDIDGSANSTQVAAYVVSGIGFLGGGVILRDGFNVGGLNTAATLWTAEPADLCLVMAESLVSGLFEVSAPTGPEGTRGLGRRLAPPTLTPSAR